MARAQSEGRRSGTRRASNGSGSGIDRRGEILTIAAKIFALKGYANSTVRDIGDEAGILSGSLYHHFSSKEAILEEILVGVLDGLVVEYTDAVTRGLPPDETMRELITIGLRFLASQPHAAAILQNDFAYLRQLDRFAVIDQRNNQIREIWLAVLRRGQRESVFRSDIDINLAYRTIMGAVLATFRWFNPSGKRSIDEVADGISSILLRGLQPD